MSISADPLSVAAEVAYRRESLSAGLPTVGRARRHHGLVESLLQRSPRLHHRHGAARPA
ncbi:hypothetical protein GCM10009867_01690 [Pedococcus aerophilus]|uniref:Uncharacterized protein n=1 Tax=Pedococcus aerophilus TaxID=436356 RepID=A0ABN3UCU2_9MICO